MSYQPPLNTLSYQPPLNTLFSQTFLDITKKTEVQIALGKNDDPVDPVNPDKDTLVKYNFAIKKYREGMTVEGAFEIMRLQTISDSDIIVNMQREQVIVYLLNTPHIRRYEHGMTIDKARKVVAALAAASEHKNI